MDGLSYLAAMLALAVAASALGIVVGLAWGIETERKGKRRKPDV